MSATESHDDHEHELVMPFVTVTSKGGPHDDDAYVAGWECGALDGRLAMLAHLGIASETRTVSAANLPQLDLIAMKHGYRMKSRPTPVESGWAFVEFGRVPDQDEAS